MKRMSAATLSPRLLVGAAAAAYGVVTVAFIFYERAGLGIAHFYYVAIALTALALGAFAGALGGLLATCLYTAGVFANSALPVSDLLKISTPIRFVTFVGMGALIGWFAGSHRVLVAEMRVLAARDLLTGLPNTRAFEIVINRRLASREPFALLVSDVQDLKTINQERGTAAGDDALRAVAHLLARAVGAADDIARIGGGEFAVLASCPSLGEAGQLAARLERLLVSQGCAVTFGWSHHPQEGDNALSLFRAADERLYARKVLRGRGSGLAAPRASVYS